MTLPPLPKDRNWSPETWCAGLDEAVRLSPCASETWESFEGHFAKYVEDMAIAHATTLLDAGIVKPVVSEGEALLAKAFAVWDDSGGDNIHKCPAAIAVIDAALDKARAG